MWTDETRLRHDRSGLRYTHDLTDEEWAEIEPLIPPAKAGGAWFEIGSFWVTETCGNHRLTRPDAGPIAL
jgi:hypothetical protein